eukprot:10414390-Karenia_brevis.AAC.1
MQFHFNKWPKDSLPGRTTQFQVMRALRDGTLEKATLQQHHKITFEWATTVLNYEQELDSKRARINKLTESKNKLRAQ